MTRYVSTRGDAPAVDFATTLMRGLADDGGLYVPATPPPFPTDHAERWRGRPYAEVAAEVLTDLVAPSIERDELSAMVAAACATFEHPDVVPLRHLDDDLWLLELFHGPTLSFKDVALQLLGRLFERELAARDTTVTIVGATSGDTGSAAIEACRDRAGIQLVMLHPIGRVSEVQRLQMTTVDAPNVHNVAIEGTFDDCQTLVKDLFGDRPLRERLRLSAVNSINWARVAAQSAYYVSAALTLGAPQRRVAFTVPTGNFGNVYSAHLSRRRGLAMGRLAVASNRNDVVTRAVEGGVLETAAVEPSLSPAMDIQVSSNFERLVWEAVGGDGAAVGEMMTELRATGRVVLPAGARTVIREGFEAVRRSDEQTLATIAEVHERHGVLVDPHTAVGIGARQALGRDGGTAHVVLACAHPAKFADTVRRATGVEPPLPERLADLAERPERCVVAPADLHSLRDLVDAVVS